MTIKEARKILDKKAEGKSDDQIRKDMEVAQFFVDMFFDMLKEGKIEIKD